ncbi:SMI1/KNR4 family protein [Runella salmonicolor]|uniref:SMI1/KNR4 family protein n=1 Tax=Runella salmonicolor TaxID=2950278 RepID=A0ABT1FL13_9BACT|nr:SMI1/KNR4 family protein [Runella salmonicolor]MCP1382392.1 SMI1/KNR4 family protein [Runella salmonicolor]
MTELEAILTKYNFPKRTTRATTKVEEIENRIGFPLPDDYKFYLDNYTEHEEFVGPELVNLWDIDELLSINKDTGIFDNLPLTLGIGNNPSSEFIAIEFMDNKNYRIVLSPFIDLDKQYHIDIGNSFTDFFVRLDNGQEWFD